MRINISEILKLPVIKKILGSCNGSHLIENVSIDSRKCTPGSLFVCIKGEYVDGHDFIQQAIKNGACAILSEKEIYGLSVPVLVVDNSIKALGNIANLWRSKTKATVIGITGSAGKTTLKEVLFEILSKHGKCAKSWLNYNNQIGLPLSVLATEGDEDFWVMEMGISRAGDMEELGKILQPDMGIILNVGSAHLEGLGEVGVAKNKTLLFQYLSKKGNAIICGDYEDLLEESKKYDIPCAQFFVLPKENKMTWRVDKLAEAEGENIFYLNGITCSARLPIRGRAGAEIALAALTCAALLGMNIQKSAAALNSIKLPPQRFNEYIYPPWHIIDDSYNANPLSMSRMFECVACKSANLVLPLFLILGEMGELGSQSSLLHEKIGEEAAQIKPDFILYKGAYFEDIKKGVTNKLPTYTSICHIQENANIEALLSDTIFQKKYQKKGGIILIKGSRSNKLELIFKKIQNFLL